MWDRRQKPAETADYDAWGQRAASSITMGVSWGISGAIVAALIGVLNQSDKLEYVFLWFGGACVVSSVLCFWLPSVDYESKK